MVKLQKSESAHRITYQTLEGFIPRMDRGTAAGEQEKA